MTTRPMRSLFTHRLSRTVIACAFVALPVLLAQNPGTDTECPNDCYLKLGHLDKKIYCMFMRGLDPCCECESCIGFQCLASLGGAIGKVGSLDFQIGVGRLPYANMSDCKLSLHASRPTADMFDPASLQLIHPLAGKISEVVTTDLDPGELRRVKLLNPDGTLMTFSFDNGETVALLDDDKQWVPWRLEALDADGDPTTGTPAFYDLYARGYGMRTRYSVELETVIWRKSWQGQTVTNDPAYVGVGVREIRVDDVLRQVKTPSALADIVIPADGLTEGDGNVCKYTVKLYRASQVGSAGGDGVYALIPGATPFVSYTFENSTTGDKDADFDHMRITREDSTTNTQVYDYEYTPGSDQWVLERGDGTDVLTKTKVYAQLDAAGVTGTRTREVREADDTLVSKRVDTYHKLSWGEPIVQTEIAVATGGSTLGTSERWYYDTPGTGTYTRPAPYAAARQKLAARVEPDGSWMMYDYDSEGRVSRLVWPWKNEVAWADVSSLTPAAAIAAGDCQSIEFLYAAITGTSDTPLDGDVRPRTVTTSTDGTVVARTYNVYTVNGDGEVVHVSEAACSPTAGYGNSGNLRTTKTWFAEDAAFEPAGRVKQIQFPDGRLDTYHYQHGTV
ncbi:MAG: hypothetical protein HN849_08155, partial [Victivallales bacterium]|nr:hypothetical protein [Victivallales bacterium]